MDQDFINLYIEKLNNKISEFIRNEIIIQTHYEALIKKNNEIQAEYDKVISVNSENSNFSEEIRQLKNTINELNNQISVEIEHTNREKEISFELLVENDILKEEIQRNIPKSLIVGKKKDLKKETKNLTAVTF